MSPPPQPQAFVFPFSGNHFQKFYFGTKEVLIPVYQKMEDALAKYDNLALALHAPVKRCRGSLCVLTHLLSVFCRFPDVDIMVNFASFRSVHASTMEALSHPQLYVLMPSSWNIGILD